DRRVEAQLRPQAVVEPANQAVPGGGTRLGRDVDVVLDLARRPEEDVNPTPVAGPPRPGAVEKQVVRLADPLPELLAILVDQGVPRRVPPRPELLDEDRALVVGLEGLERLDLVVVGEPLDGPVQPPGEV